MLCLLTRTEDGSWGHGKDWGLLLWDAGLGLLSWAPLLLQIEIQTLMVQPLHLNIAGVCKALSNTLPHFIIHPFHIYCISTIF